MERAGAVEKFEVKGNGFVSVYFSGLHGHFVVFEGEVGLQWEF